MTAAEADREERVKELDQAEEVLVAKTAVLNDAKELSAENRAILDDLTVQINAIVDSGMEATQAYCAMPEPQAPKSYLGVILASVAVCFACLVTFCLRFH